MSQCDSCKHALIDTAPGGRAVFITCRCPTLSSNDETQTCPDYDKGAPVRRQVRRPREAEGFRRLGD